MENNCNLFFNVFLHVQLTSDIIVNFKFNKFIQLNVLIGNQLAKEQQSNFGGNKVERVPLHA